MRILVRPQQQYWWLNPIVIVLAFHIPLAFAALLTPDSSYEILWKVPKYFTGNALLLTISTSVALVIGALVGMRPSISEADPMTQSVGPAQIKMLSVMFRLCVALTLLGYLTFAVAAYSRGASLGMFVELLRGQSGVSTDLKKNYFQTLPGITTCTQFGMAAALLGVLVARFTNNWKPVRVPLILLVICSLLRAVFLSERLALVEVILPATVLCLRVFSSEIQAKTWRKNLFRVAPLGAPVFLYFFFAIFESFRSWTYYSTSSASSLWEFAFGRLCGYYLTSMNNSAYLFNTWNYKSWVPGFTFEWLLKFPVVGSLIAGGSDVLADRGTYLESLLSAGVSTEFNNPGGMLCPMFDFGVTGGLIFWLLTGFILGKLYGLFRQGTLGGLLFYPLAVLSLMEVPRLLYWTAGRTFPTIFILILTLSLVGDAGKREALTPARA